MPQPKLSKLELQILEALWTHGKASILEIQESFPEPRPAYTTIQTTVYRLEGKKALRRVRKISNADIFKDQWIIYTFLCLYTLTLTKQFSK